ncbi:head completion/stabilization protein [Caulobacter segnis]|uniref:Head completion/stabilization protein n=1 Tax=Caulobacter segnis TaxID=88688 RepID=A0A2W5VB93_9CAUL|nr:head completion/stabilization protein [Caulobacter segnis]PZR37169.1 MAG: hypothetical protein DI526_01240 [Caulobacter segnis]
MTTFTLPDPATPAPPTGESIVLTGDPFFPAIEPAKFQAAMRVVSQVTPERINDALIDAMLVLDRNPDLQARKAAWLTEGYNTLGDVPASEFGGQHRLEFLYRRAVYSLAKADLDEKYRDNAATDAGERRAEGVDIVVGSHMRNARNAISDLVARPRITIEQL